MNYRIVDFERDPPPGVNFGKINIELWDCSGDMKYEKCWSPI
jgi:Rab-like protein 5